MRHAIDDADRQLGVARSVISGHRGWIGADARTRLAEAERIRLDLSAISAQPIGEDDREQVLADARRCGQLAAEALQLAQRDIDSSRPNDGGWGGWNDYPWGAGLAIGTAAAVTAAAWGSIYYSLPAGCSPYPYYSYYSCGGVYYEPRYQGDTVVYVTVPPPTGSGASTTVTTGGPTGQGATVTTTPPGGTTVTTTPP